MVVQSCSNKAASLVILLAAVATHLYPNVAAAESTDFVWNCPGTDRGPDVSVTKLDSGHLVSWGNCDATASLNTGFSLKGYEVDYLGESQFLTFGATGTSWLDDIDSHRVLNPYTERCNASSYRVRAVTKKNRGSQQHSDWVAAAADDLCAGPNQHPVARITTISTTDLDVSFALLGSGSTDSDGSVESWNWASQPASGIEFGNTALEDTTATITEEGNYTITLTVTDNDGARNSTSVEIIAVTGGGGNQTPIVDAGGSVNLTLVDSAASATLIGLVLDDAPLDQLASILWEFDSGSSSCADGNCAIVLATPGELTTLVEFTQTGSYVFRLTVIDEQGAQGEDTVTVNVSEDTVGLGHMVWIGQDAVTTIPVCDGQDYLSRSMEGPIGDMLWSTEFNDADWKMGSDTTGISNRYQRWNTAYAWGPETIINNESQYYVDSLGIHPTINNWSPFQQAFGSDESNNGRTGEGYLVIQAAPTELAERSDLSALGQSQDYLSGVITSREEVGGDLTYGYFEARLRTAPGNGTWSAYWLNHTAFRKSNEPEADIIEYLGQSKPGAGNCELSDREKLLDPETTANDLVNSNPSDSNYCYADHPSYTNESTGAQVNNKTYNTYDTQYHTYWYGRGRREERTPLAFTNRDGNSDTPPWCGERVNFSEEFHTYGFLWAPTEMVWYIDDIEVMRVDSSNPLPIADENMYLVLNLALGKYDYPWISWPGQPDAWTRSQFNVGGYNKVSMAIDYVRVYSINP